MNCHDVESILASGTFELTAEARSHLASCPACAEFHSGELQRTSRGFSTWQR